MADKYTIGDIARKAGVSIATVSRVMNNKPYVDLETRSRVLRVVEELKFVPSAIASNLASGRSRFLGILVPSFAWLFIPDVMYGVSQAIGQTQNELLLYTIDSFQHDHSKRDLIDRILFPKITAGLLAIFPGQLAEHIVRLHIDGEFPVVMIHDQEQPPPIPWVGADNFGGAYAAVKHLLALGHRRIAHIKGPATYFCVDERYKGYCQALLEAGLSLDPALVVEGDFGTDAGEAATHQLFNLPLEQRPSAIFSANDGMAYGVILAAEQRGLRIPQDIALVGFDDLAATVPIRPALTTVHQPFYEMGKMGIELLLSLIDAKYELPLSSDATQENDGKEMNTPVIPLHVQLPTRLVVRASCGALAK